MTPNLTGASELFLGRDRATALALGPRRFRTAVNAIRFAMEQAAPVSLRGAILKVGTRQFGPAEIQRLHRKMAATASSYDDF
jgi:hypothetical protein